MPTIDGYTNGEPIEAVDINQYFLRGSRNALINGDMRVAQRGGPFIAVNDNTYTLDRWVLLSDGNGVVDVVQANLAPPAGLNSIGIAVRTPNKKFGILQVIENRNIVGMFNQQVTLSFTATTEGSGSINNLKAAILSWTGTTDTVTRDVVSAWGADGVTPTFAANWTAENISPNLALSNDWTRFVMTANLNTLNAKNLAVFIWCDDMTTTPDDLLYITDVQLESGAIATPFERKTFQEQLADCQRYYQQYREPRLRGVIGSSGAPFRMGMVIPTMRTAPTSSTNGGTIGIFDGSTATTPVFSIGNDYTLQNHSVEYDLGGSGFNNFRPALAYYTGATGILFLTAEL
jgi:hypothetical protein